MAGAKTTNIMPTMHLLISVFKSMIFGSWKQNIPIATISVSYTHLDVYKRQAQMPHFSIDDLKILKTRNPSVHILVISQDNDKKNIYQAIDYGVLSFLTKECDQEEILNAIFATAKGQKFLCHKVIDIIIEKHSHTGEDLCKAINLSDSCLLYTSRCV